MSAADLQQEIAKQKRTVAKMRLAIANQSDKNTSKLRKERKTLARLSTVLTEKQAEELQKSKQESTVSAPSKS